MDNKAGRVCACVMRKLVSGERVVEDNDIGSVIESTWSFFLNLCRL